MEEAYQEAQGDTEDEHLRDLELESLKRLINQLKEEIARYEARQPARRWICVFSSGWLPYQFDCPSLPRDVVLRNQPPPIRNDVQMRNRRPAF